MAELITLNGVVSNAGVITLNGVVNQPSVITLNGSTSSNSVVITAERQVSQVVISGTVAQSGPQGLQGLPGVKGDTGTNPIAVQATAPSNPVLDALWVDTA